VWEAERAEDVIATQAARRLVVKRGRVSVEHARSATFSWRDGSHRHHSSTRVEEQNRASS
jgi:hypothetical protein